MWSLNYINAPEDKRIIEESGTSMATPEVAGLAAYVWTLDPSLHDVRVIDILRDTARSLIPNTASDTDRSLMPSASVIDAYAAVLATDSDLAGGMVRSVLLDVADNLGTAGSDGRFDEHDVELLLRKFDELDGALDYSRYDLNGDGEQRAQARSGWTLMKSSPPSVPVAWEKCGKPGTPAWAALWPSRRSGSSTERFKQEARSIAALNHPNICQIFDIGDDYLVLEYIEGKPLSSPIPGREAVRLAIQIATALYSSQQRDWKRLWTKTGINPAMPQT